LCSPAMQNDGSCDIIFPNNHKKEAFSNENHLYPSQRISGGA
jgi:hypothetical protein